TSDARGESRSDPYRLPASPEGNGQTRSRRSRLRFLSAPCLPRAETCAAALPPDGQSPCLRWRSRASAAEISGGSQSHAGSLVRVNTDGVCPEIPFCILSPPTRITIAHRRGIDSCKFKFCINQETRMKLLRYGLPGREAPGVLDDQGQIRDISSLTRDVDGAFLASDAFRTLQKTDLSQLPLVSGQPRLGPCVGAIGKFVCIGLNYADHAAE